MAQSDLDAHLRDPARLAALQAVALLDTPSEEAFDRLSRLATRLLDAPVALVSLVDAHRQFFKSCIGLNAEPWSSDRETPLSHSFCQHNRFVDQPLVVDDARSHPEFRDNEAVADLGVIAYLGFPLATADGYVLGSFCVIDTKPRKWAVADIDILRDLAASVMVEIQLRSEVETRTQLEGERDLLNELNEKLIDEIDARRRSEQARRDLETQLQQTRRIEAIGQLAGGVAHDLNNLLSPILIYTSVLLRDEQLASNHRDIVDQIQATGVRARDLIRQLLTFSRLQAMKFEVQDLNAIVSGLERLLRRTIPEDIHMDVELAHDLPAIVADANQIEQILMNLAVNAADAMPDGGSLLIATSASLLEEAELSANEDAEPGWYATLTVTDSGVGMDPATIDKVFDPFFSTKGNEGNGMGLSTVLGIALQHGGVVHCFSRRGHGATFEVHIPATSEIAIASGDGEPIVLTGGSATILVCEDDDQVRAGTELVLRQHGYNVISAANGEEALSTITYYGGPIHLLLTDVVMPGINGRVLYEQALEQRPSLRVLYMSGYSNDIISHRGVLEDGINFIAKPFLEHELLAQIQLIVPSVDAG